MVNEHRGGGDGFGSRGPEADLVAPMVVRAVNEDMSGRPVDKVYRVLNARLHAGGASLATDEVWELADAISDGTFDGTGDER
jgi:hypothetical protein